MFFGIIGVTIEVLGAGAHLFAFVSWPRSLSSLAAINGPDSRLHYLSIEQNYPQSFSFTFALVV